MAFENEETYPRATRRGKGEAFQARFDAALEAVEEDFGRNHPLYVGGKAVATEEAFEDRSPGDRDRLLGRFPRGGRAESAQAVEAAQAAFPAWARTDWRERVRIFRRAADLLAREKFELAALMCHENGKNRLEAMADVDEAVDFCRWYGAQLETNEGFDRELGRAVPEERTRSVLKPYGVWAVISPFNFPLAIACGMTVGAVITGNTAVLKPATDTPYVALRLYELLAEAGLPDGVLNLVTGPGGSAGAELVENGDVAGLLFTGSRQVGVASFHAFTKAFPKPVVTEMGGKNPVLVTEHADLEKAVLGVGRGAFGFGGQKCSATSRVYVHRDLYDAFVARLVAWTETLTVGDPTDRDTYLGPVINERAYRNYQESAAKATRDGKVRTGGRTRTDGRLARGYYVEPTVVDGLPQGHPLVQNELFIPLVCVLPMGSLEEGLRQANESEYGLCAGIFTEDEGERQAFFDGVEAGVAYCNRVQGATTGAIVGAQPFVGWKRSGISGKGAGSLYYLQQFLREQSQTHYV